MINIRHARIASAAVALIFALTDITLAGSLAGQVGDRRFYPTRSGNPKDACTSAYNAYVAASGHSAYATTPYFREIDLYIICGAKLNARTQKEAEVAALKGCEEVRANHRVVNAGPCEIALSK